MRVLERREPLAAGCSSVGVEYNMDSDGVGEDERDVRNGVCRCV